MRKTETPNKETEIPSLYFSSSLQVDSARKHEILLEAVQVLTDLNLCIRKAYISSDGRWFMDGKAPCYHAPLVLRLVRNPFYLILFLILLLCIAAVFHVTDQNGDKLTDESVLRYIERVIKSIYTRQSLMD